MVEKRAAAVSSRLDNHWEWQPDWTRDRPCLMWYLTFENQPGLASHAEALQSRLTVSAALDPIPVPWLHLTLDQVGFVDTVPPQLVDDVVESVRGTVQDWSPEPVSVGPVTTMGGAVVLETAGVDGLHDRVRAGTAAALGRDAGEEFREFRAHVSLAYANQPCDADEVVRLGAEAEHRVPLDTPRLALTSVTRRDRHYQWSEREALPVPAGGPAV